ncbi:MAG TPA: MFS transporter [Verrucomicrobiae bacterium]|nr:MFS transporter [Verrucomicrobiae bacterium]
MSESASSPGSSVNAPTLHAHRLLWAGFMAILAEGVGFSIRGGILAQGLWAHQFGFTNTELGVITGAGLTGFGVIIIFSSLIADKIGYGRLMFGAFALHSASAVLTLLTGAAFAAWGKPAAAQCLFWGTFLFALGNGLCEGVANPLIASLFPKNKSKYLSILHAGWPGGLILGGLASYFMCGGVGGQPVKWEIQMCAFLIPVAIYGGMLLGQKFPKSEASEHGVKQTDMLRELGFFGALILCALLTLWFHDLLSTTAWMHNLVGDASWLVAAVMGGVLLLAFGVSTKFAPGYFILVLLLVVHSLQGYVELGTDSWTAKISGAIMTSAQSGLLLTVYISGLMFVLRFFAGPIVHKISPLGLLFVSTVLASIGLALFGHADSAMFCILAATVFALGKTFMWPTLLAVVSERFPKGGAITIGAMGGAGMLCAGLLGGPGIGYNQDSNAADKLTKEHPQVYERYKASAPNSFLMFTTTGLDGAKVGVLDDNGKELDRTVELLAKENRTDASTAALNTWWASAKTTAAEDKPIVTEAELNGDRKAMSTTAVLPIVQAVLLLGMILYFKSSGGYKQVHIEGAGQGAKEVA